MEYWIIAGIVNLVTETQISDKEGKKLWGKYNVNQL